MTHENPTVSPEPRLTPPSTARADRLCDLINDELIQLDREVKRLNEAWKAGNLGAVRNASDAVKDVARTIWDWTMELEDDAFDRP